MDNVLGIDGVTDQALVAMDGCCPPSICTITLCSVACNFVSALPRGPLWDRSKSEVMQRAQTNPCAGDYCPPGCFSIVAHAVYTANRLWTLLQDALWPSIRESDPFTCFDTVDDWLRRLGWVDCFAAACRDRHLGDLTPLEVMLNGIATYTTVTYPSELTLAVKLGIVRSLARLDMGIIPNLDAVNFVIAPLGAQVEAVGLSCAPWPCVDGCDPPDTGCIDSTGFTSTGEPPDPCCRRCDHPVWRIGPVGSTFLQPILSRCDIESPGPNTQTIPAFVTRESTSSKIWPGVLAAECIVRSLIPPGTYLEIQRNS